MAWLLASALREYPRQVTRMPIRTTVAARRLPDMVRSTWQAYAREMNRSGHR